MPAELDPNSLASATDFSGIDGFLGTRGSLMLDVVFLAMFAVVPVMFWSIYRVRARRHYALHRNVQLGLALVLAIAVGAFELDMRLFTDWQQRAAPSPFFHVDSPWQSVVGYALIIHLAFAVPTFFVWIYVIIDALRKFPRPIGPNAHSRRHRRWGWLAASGMTMTAVTGWIFYALAFVAG